MNPCEFSISITAIANAIACNLSDDELGLAAASFTQLGDTLNTILIQRGICSSRNAKELGKNKE